MDYKEKLKRVQWVLELRGGKKEEWSLADGISFTIPLFFSPAPHLRDLPYHHKFSNTTQTSLASYLLLTLVLQVLT